MINKFQKYRILITIYLIGLLFSILTAYYVNKNNIFTGTTGKFIEISFAYNPEIFDKIREFNNYIPIYTHIRSANSIKSFNAPTLSLTPAETIENLNLEYSVFERYLTTYLYKHYPDTALSKEYRNFYGKLYMNYDVELGQEPRVILIIRGDNSNDFEAYKSFIIKATSQSFINKALLYKKNIELRMSELERAIINVKNDNSEKGYNFTEQNNSLENFFYLEKYTLKNILNLTDALVKSLNEINILNDIDVRYYKKSSNSMYFIIPMIFLIVISFFVLLHRIIYDFRKK